MSYFWSSTDRHDVSFNPPEEGEQETIDFRLYFNMHRFNSFQLTVFLKMPTVKVSPRSYDIGQNADSCVAPWAKMEVKKSYSRKVKDRRGRNLENVKDRRGRNLGKVVDRRGTSLGKAEDRRGASLSVMAEDRKRRNCDRRQNKKKRSRNWSKWCQTEEEEMVRVKRMTEEKGFHEGPRKKEMSRERAKTEGKALWIKDRRESTLDQRQKRKQSLSKTQLESIRIKDRRELKHSGSKTEDEAVFFQKHNWNHSASKIEEKALWIKERRGSSLYQKHNWNQSGSKIEVN